MVKEVHTSDMRRFKLCRRMWNYRSPLRAGYRPVKRKLYFTRGIAWHDGLESWYVDGAPPEVRFAKTFKQSIKNQMAQGAEFDAEEIKDQLDIGETVLAMYPKWAREHDDFELIASEETGNWPLTDGIEFSYRADQVVRRRGGIWMHDFKTVETLPEDILFLDYDEQITSYMKVLEDIYGEPVSGALFTYLLVKKPTEPQELKNGGLSVAKKIYTTPEVYWAKIKELGLDPRPYKEFLQQLNERCIWFKRFEIIKTKAQKEVLWRSHQRVAAEMVDPDVHIYPAPSPLNCKMCAYQAPCYIEGSGGNPISVLEAEYVRPDEED
jgi:hypothetical protein